ncbi:MAG: hypothetical protein M5U12_02505 [Verrucomicrobia bacterium]|nr:hypothetical protein [Verrucomicrobiota bacterium]
MLWDIDLPAGRLRDHALRIRGWTIVSAQNQHLDGYAVLFAPDIWRMGDYLGRPDLKRLAAVMYRSCGQLIDPEGSQGEQIQQTNFGQSGDMTDVFRLRGGYNEGWTAFWITAHFLNTAARFEAMGADLDREVTGPGNRDGDEVLRKQNRTRKRGRQGRLATTRCPHAAPGETLGVVQPRGSGAPRSADQ